jgi:hypothetical protein
MKKYQNGAKLKAEGKYLKEKGLSSKKEGLRIKAVGQYLKTGKAKPTYKQKYSVTLPMKDFPEDKTFEKTQILNKGPKTIVNRKSFSRYAEGMQTPVSKSTTVYDKKTGKTKVSKNYKKGGKLHLGFKETQAKIAKKQGISMEAAGAILASSARKASPAAVKKNPALLNVKRGKVKKYQDGGKTIKSDTISKPNINKQKFTFNIPPMPPLPQAPETMQKSEAPEKPRVQKIGFKKGGKVKKYGDGGKTATTRYEDRPYDKGLFVNRKATKTSTKGKGTKIITNTTSTTYSSGKKYDGNYGNPNFSKSTFSVDTAGYSNGK